jgi:hypothetical protein
VLVCLFAPPAIARPAPWISGFSPTSGSAGTPVTISGFNLSGATRVAFNGTPASYRVTDPTQITATLPSGAASGPISVTTPSGSNTTRGSFTVEPVMFRVFVGYYDTHHNNNPQPKPDPWQGSPNVVFIGTPDSSRGGWDTSAVRIDNLGSTPLRDAAVTVDIGSHSFALWGETTIPAHQSLILAQTKFENFDGSDTNPEGCSGPDTPGCTSSAASTIPVVHVTINGTTSDIRDVAQILNTHGVDGAGSPPTGSTTIRNDESEAWQQLPGCCQSPQLPTRILTLLRLPV